MKSPIRDEIDTTVEETFNRLLDNARQIGEKQAVAEAEALRYTAERTARDSIMAERAAENARAQAVVAKAEIVAEEAQEIAATDCGADVAVSGDASGRVGSGSVGGVGNGVGASTLSRNIATATTSVPLPELKREKEGELKNEGVGTGLSAPSPSELEREEQHHHLKKKPPPPPQGAAAAAPAAEDGVGTLADSNLSPPTSTYTVTAATKAADRLAKQRRQQAAAATHSAAVEKVNVAGEVAEQAARVAEAAGSEAEKEQDTGLGLSLGLTLRRLIEEERKSAGVPVLPVMNGVAGSVAGGDGVGDGVKDSSGKKKTKMASANKKLSFAELGNEGMRVLQWHVANIEYSTGVSSGFSFIY